MIINSLKNNKTTGYNDIYSELLKLVGLHPVIQMQKLIGSIWTNKQTHNDWNTAIVCPIFIKRNKLCVEKDRRISLIESYKVL